MKSFRTLAAVPLVLVMAGCAGGAVPILYAGTYSGTYSPVMGAGDSGTMTIKIDSLGSISGVVNDVTKGETTNAAAGSIDNNGHLNLSAPFTQGADTFAGNLGFASTGHLTGTITESGAVNQQVAVDLTRM